MSKSALPIDEHLISIASSVARTPVTIVKAAPGAGKTTRVPTALLESVNGEILVLEPRRLAARLSAERISEELGEKPGDTVGFHIRFEQAHSSRTRVKFITEGLFLRYLIQDPKLSHVGCVILDEFHERHVHTDVALALTRWLQKNGRPELRLVLMSATLSTDALGTHFPEAQIFESEGRTYPVEIEYFPPAPRWNTSQAVAAGVEKLFHDKRCTGHILAFLPGAGEIRRTKDELVTFAQKNDAELLELRAEIPISEQRRVFAECVKRKIILSTNVAETSVTIPGVTGVVDSGLAKIPGHATWSGLPTLDTKPISRSSCIQRAGRAGRTSAGVAVRLFEKSDFDARPVAEKPEILRSDLAQTLLDLMMVSQPLGLTGIALLKEIDWLDKPSDSIVNSGFYALTLLGAIDANGHLTSLGERMAKLPIHPRLSRTLEESRALSCGAHGALAVALLSEGMLLRKGTEAPRIGDSDVTFQMEIFAQLLAKNNSIQRVISCSLDPAKLHRTETLARNLCQITGEKFADCLKPFNGAHISQAFLAGFPDRVGRVRVKQSQQHQSTLRGRIEVTLCQGGGAVLSNASVVQQEEFLLALDADESMARGNSATSTQIQVASGITANQLLTDPAGFLSDREDYIWDDEAKRVRGFSRIMYGQIVIDESSITAHNPRVEETLFKALQQRWPKPFDTDEALQFLKVRCEIIHKLGFPIRAPDFTNTHHEALLRHLCVGKKSFAEVAAQPLENAFSEFLSPDAYQMLEELTPREIKVGSGRRVKVHYDEGKQPWTASRLQDFFGTLNTPTIARGRISLVVHLLAPNGQALQVTTDLASFWTNAYPSLRKEYSRRYPRHYWPEDPKVAEPPPQGRIRPRP